jgi:hypothetical protein
VCYKIRAKAYVGLEVTAAGSIEDVVEGLRELLALFERVTVARVLVEGTDRRALGGEGGDQVEVVLARLGRGERRRLKRQYESATDVDLQ